MKLFSLLFISILFIQITSLAQSGWVQQTSGTTYDLYSVNFINPNSGWTVGQNYDLKNGIILKTSNGGDNWDVQVIDSIRLRDIQFIDENTGWITGGNVFTDFNSFVSFKTTDGGTNWDTTQIVNNVGSPGKIFFINNNIGWLTKYWTWPSTDPYLFKSTDGGFNWFDLQAPDDGLTSIFFIDQDDGWVVTGPKPPHATGGIIFKTTDGGLSWTEQFQMPIPYGRPGYGALYSIYFSDNNNGWAVGNAEWADSSGAGVIGTIDGGENWSEPLENCYVKSISQEHGIVKLSEQQMNTEEALM